LISRAVVQNEFRTAVDLVDRVGGGAGGGVKAVAPTGSESVTITIPEGEEEVSLLGEKLTVERLDGAHLHAARPPGCRRQKCDDRIPAGTTTQERQDRRDGQDG